MRIPALRIQIMLESNPLKSIILVGRLGVAVLLQRVRVCACAHDSCGNSRQDSHACFATRHLCMQKWARSQVSYACTCMRVTMPVCTSTCIVHTWCTSARHTWPWIHVSTHWTTGVCEQSTPFVQALALQSSSRNCNPAFDLVFWQLFFPPLFLSRGVFFHRHRYAMPKPSSAPTCAQQRRWGSARPSFLCAHLRAIQFDSIRKYLDTWPIRF